MIVTLAGPNQFLLKKSLDETTRQFMDKYGELALERLDGEDIEPQAVIDAVQSLPFLAERKLVVVRNLSANKLAAEKIEQIISSVATPVSLVFYEPLPDKRTVFYKTLKAKTDLREFTDLDGRGLATWLATEATARRGELKLADANYLVERVGTNQALLGNELDKLIIYDPKISRQNIDLLTEKTPQGKVFDLLDAAFGGNQHRALALYDEQRAQKIEPQAILAMLAWQLNILAVAKHGAGKQPNEIAQDLGVSPYPVSKAAALARQMDAQKIKNLVNEAEKIDRLGKTKAIDLDEALKTYIATI